MLGARVVHADFVDKVKGTLAYADDWHMPGMLHGKVVRSFDSSAKIVSIDTSDARSLPGVHAVLTA